MSRLTIMNSTASMSICVSAEEYVGTCEVGERKGCVIGLNKKEGVIFKSQHSHYQI